MLWDDALAARIYYANMAMVYYRESATAMLKKYGGYNARYTVMRIRFEDSRDAREFNIKMLTENP